MPRRMAPVLLAWQKRNPLGGPRTTRGGGGSSGTLSDGAALQVEVLIDGLWENFSQMGLVRYDDRVDITNYGQSSQGDQTDPARCTFRLKNLASQSWPFSDGSVNSPYWGKFGRNTRVRISVPNGFDKSFRFQGEISEIDEETDISGEDTTILVVAVGILDRLGRGDKPLHSALYREIMGTDPLGTRTKPVAFWPMEDNEGAEFLTNVVDPGREMFFNGDPALRQYEFACTEGVPNVSGTRFWAACAPYSFPGSVAGPRASSVWFLLNADAITTNMVLIRVTTASHTFDISYVATNNVRLVITALADGTTLFDSGSVAVSAGILSKDSWFCLHIMDNANQQIYALNHQDMASHTLSGLLAHNASGASTGPVRRVHVNPNGIAGDVHIGMVTVFKHLQTDENVANGYVATDGALKGYAEERADVRFNRLLTEEQITREVTDPLTLGGLQGVGQKMGIQQSETLINLLRECQATDGGIIYEMTSDFGLGYRTLASMTSQDPALTLSMTNHELAEQPQPLRDNNGNVNEMTVQREGGSSATYVDDFSKMSILEPPAGIGRYNNQVTLSLFSDSQNLDQAGWAVHKGTWPEPRFERIVVGLHRTPFVGTALRAGALGVVLGDRVDVGDLPVRLGYEDIAQLNLGRSEVLDQFMHTITWNAVPERPYRTMILDDAEFDRLDMGDSHVVSAIGPTDTSVSVESLDGAVWADSAGYAAEFPFDVMVAGERWTVTAISGTTSPQTFTVTRSVNGVVKSHAAGADVHTYDATYLAL